MKKIKTVVALMAVAAVGAVVGGVELADIMNFLFGCGGATLAFAAVGVPTTDAVSAAGLDTEGLVDQDLSRDITQFNPDRFPLDTITREYLKKKKGAESQKVIYYQKSTKPFKDTLDSSAQGAGSADSAPASANTASANNAVLYIWVKVMTPSTWRTKDTLVMRDLNITEVVGTGTSFKSDVVFQVAEKKDTALKLVPISGMKNSLGKFIVPTFAATDVLYRLGNAMSEKAMTTEPFAVYPDEFEQYCQNFMAMIEETTFASITAKKPDWDMNDMEIENIYSMRGEMEASFLFGEKFEIKAGSDTTLFTGGIVRSIDKELHYGTNGNKVLTKEQYTAWMKSLFTGNNGSKSRVLFAGAGLIEAISLLRETYKTMQNNTNMETFLGVKCTSIVSDFGTLKIVHNPILDETGWSDRGIAIDLEHLYKKEFVPMKATEIDLKGSGQRNANAKVIQEVSCLILRHPDCHAIIKPAA